MKRRRRSRQAGVSVIEVVMLTPLVIGFVMLIVCFGILVDARANIQGAARDAARSGSLERDAGSALDAAKKAATDDGMDGTCNQGWSIAEVNPSNGAATTAFAPGDLYTVQITCNVSLGGLNWFGLPTKTFVIEATAPLDIFRRSTP
jgi:Flp pilus assembly protein TadG